MWLRGNALEDWDLDLGESLDANAFCGNVDARLCVVSVTLWRGEHGGLFEMNVDQRSMLRVAGEILLAFCFVTPLMLLLCFLV